LTVGGEKWLPLLPITIFVASSGVHDAALILDFVGRQAGEFEKDREIFPRHFGQHMMALDTESVQISRELARGSIVETQLGLAVAELVALYDKQEPVRRNRTFDSLQLAKRAFAAIARSIRRIFSRIAVEQEPQTFGKMLYQSRHIRVGRWVELDILSRHGKGRNHTANFRYFFLVQRTVLQIAVAGLDTKSDGRPLSLILGSRQYLCE
jgi:hypothetical protein